MNNNRLNRTILNVNKYIILIFISLIILVPFIWMLSTSLKTFSNIFLFPPQWIPSPIAWENYVTLFQKSPFHLYMFNSFYIAVIVTIGACLFSSLAGYAFAKIKFPFRNTIFLILLSSMMIPTESTAIPLFIWFSKIGFIDTHLPLIFPPMLGAAGMFGVFLFRQFYIALPNELDEAAKIDGCNPWMTYWLIILPISTPTFATLSIFTVLNTWNEFFEPLIYLNSSKLYTIPLALSLFTTESGTEWHLIMSASVIASLPLLIIFFLAQRKIIEGIAITGLK
jgi:multiple sugar transport system permease protein